MIKLICVILLISQSVLFSQAVDSTKLNKAKYDPENYISVDGLLLLFGAVNPGAERRIVDEFSVFASVGTGSMWFTKINEMFEVGAKYRLTAILKNNFYLGLSYNKMSLSYKDKTASSSSVGMLFGYYHIFFSWLRCDANGGLYISNDPSVTFEEISGHLTKSVTVGGLNFGGSLRVGIAF